MEFRALSDHFLEHRKGSRIGAGRNQIKNYELSSFAGVRSMSGVAQVGNTGSFQEHPGGCLHPPNLHKLTEPPMVNTEWSLCEDSYSHLTEKEWKPGLWEVPARNR